VQYIDLNPTLRMTRVHAPSARPPAVVLSAEETHHLTRVLRAHAGDAVVVFDGAGHEWDARVASVGRAGAVVDLLAARTPVAEPVADVTLGLAWLKGDQMDHAVRDATMLGARAIQPLTSAHVALPDRARQAPVADRWTRVAIASAKQCGRATVPIVLPVRTLAEVLRAPASDLGVMAVEPAIGDAGDIRDLPRQASVLVLVGPEGGWSAGEVDAARACGARLVALGPRTLRAETAPAVVLSALWTAWGWQ
jgi:16S rRNA (uracil1498-N3)-methyltransferase